MVELVSSTVAAVNMALLPMAGVTDMEVFTAGPSVKYSLLLLKLAATGDSTYVSDIKNVGH